MSVSMTVANVANHIRWLYEIRFRCRLSPVCPCHGMYYFVMNNGILRLNFIKYNKLGVDWASSLLGFLSIVFIPIPFALYFVCHSFLRGWQASS